MDSNTNNTISNILSLSNRTFSCYCFWCCILILKMQLMSVITAVQRFRKKVFPNKEDLFFKDCANVQFNDPAVERVRRAHRNDMENILPHISAGFLYICTTPSTTTACNLFRIAAAARILHTLVYAFRPVPQPSRIISFFAAYGCTLYMALTVALQTIRAL